jgi:hypothetical protein
MIDTAIRDRHLRQLVYCVVLIGIFAAFAKTVPPKWRDLWQKMRDDPAGVSSLLSQ